MKGLNCLIFYDKYKNIKKGVDFVRHLCYYVEAVCEKSGEKSTFKNF